MREVFFQGGLLVQSGVSHMLVDRVYGHLSDVLCCLRRELNPCKFNLGNCCLVFVSLKAAENFFGFQGIKSCLLPIDLAPFLDL